MNFNAINPIARALLQAQLPGGSYLIPSGSSGINCETQRGQVADSCQVTSVIPATYEQNQFSTNVDHRLAGANRIAAKFFYANQPSRDPLSNGNALTRHEIEEVTSQRTLSLSHVHIFRSSIVNELRGGFFRNRNNTVPVSDFTNAEFGIVNPFAPRVPDLTQLQIDGDDAGGTLRFGTPGGGSRVFDTQSDVTFGDTLSFMRGRHAFRVGGELRRHHLTATCRSSRTAATTSIAGSIS